MQFNVDNFYFNTFCVKFTAIPCKSAHDPFVPNNRKIYRLVKLAFVRQKFIHLLHIYIKVRRKTISNLLHFRSEV
jgi:hypothetical protein